jgi:hypothetical protein
VALARNSVNTWIITVPAGGDNRAWYLDGHASRHQFINIPNIFARSAEQLLVPRGFEDA